MGLAAGVARTLVLASFLSNLLYGANPTDPLTFFAIGLSLAGDALVASYLTAQRTPEVGPNLIRKDREASVGIRASGGWILLQFHPAYSRGEGTSGAASGSNHRRFKMR